MKGFLYITILILTTALVPIGSARAQLKTLVKFNPSTLPQELDVYLSHELSEAVTVELGGGFIYTDYWDNILNQIDFGQLKPNINEHQYLNAKGYAARLGLRFYIISPKEERKAAGTYFEPMLLFKQIWYPKKEKTLDMEDHVESGIKYLSGLQLLIGRQHKWHSFYLDKYIGLGIKAKTYRYDNFQKNERGNEVFNDWIHTTTWLPDIELGIKIAFDFSKKQP